MSFQDRLVVAYKDFKAWCRMNKIYCSHGLFTPNSVAQFPIKSWFWHIHFIYGLFTYRYIFLKCFGDLNSQGIQGKDARGPCIEQSIQLQSFDLMAFVLLYQCCLSDTWTWEIARTLAIRQWARMAWTWDDISNSHCYDTFPWLENQSCMLVVSHEPKPNQPRPILGMHSLAICGWWRLLRGTCGLAVSGLVNGWTGPCDQ